MNGSSQHRLPRQCWPQSNPPLVNQLVSDEPCRTWVINPQEVVRVGLEQFVRRHEALSFRGGAGSLAESAADIQRQRTAVIIVDQSCWTRPAERALIETFERKPGHRIVMVLESPPRQMVIDVLAEQFAAVVLRSSSYEQFRMAIDAVVQGQCYIDPSLTVILLAHLREAPQKEDGGGNVLSVQEYRILPLLSEGKTNKEIGRVLGLSDKTIKNYLANIFSKLQVSRRTQVAAKYAEGSVCHK